jgi:hypothetical protein
MALSDAGMGIGDAFSTFAITDVGFWNFVC